MEGGIIKVCMISYSQYEDDSRIHRYAASLIAAGHQVDMIGLGNKGQPKREMIYGVMVYRLQSRDFNEKSPFSYLWRLVQFFVSSSFFCSALYAKKRYDVIHYHNIPDHGIFCTLIPKLFGAKIILDIHDIVPEFYMRKFEVQETHWVIKALKQIEKWAASYADLVITVTDIWKDRLIERSVKPEKCLVIMNVPDYKLFNPAICKNKISTEFIFSYHGNLSETTGVGTAIQAFASVSLQMPNARMRIIGQGRRKTEYSQLIQDLHLENEISILDVVPVTDIPLLLCEASVGLDPKEGGIYAGETLSVKAMEYLGMEIPVIVSKTDASSRYFTDQMVAYFDPGNTEEMASRMLELYQSNEKRKQLIEQGRNFTQKYNWKNFEQAYLHRLAQLVS